MHEFSLTFIKGLLFTGFLLLFHIKLIYRNETTNEYLKGRSDHHNYEFRESSICKRFTSAFCPKRTRSKIPNSLVKQSLAVEKVIDSEKFLHSHGGTPRRSIPGKFFGEA